MLETHPESLHYRDYSNDQPSVLIFQKWLYFFRRYFDTNKKHWLQLMRLDWTTGALTEVAGLTFPETGFILPRFSQKFGKKVIVYS